MIKKLSILALLISFISCQSLNSIKSELDSVSDKNFILSEFVYIHTGADTDSAFSEMSAFPVKKIMYLLASEYNIQIDISDFNRFAKTKKKNEIKAEGFFRLEKFSWKSSIPSKNRITLTFEKDYMDTSKMSLVISIIAQDKIIKNIKLEFSKIEFMFRQLKFYLPQYDKNENEYNIKSYENSQSVPGLIIGTIDDNVKATLKEEEIKRAIEDYIKTLSTEEKKSFKHDMIDFIYRVCE
ncbi:MAG TPA: hypothetical protein PKX79_01510 [Spirochaetota bacterium]|jgi:hypothetical protein|nr:hypothetical protein [Spirochaetota bacterium]HOK91463.1 hypothetical protein [Spirochaetota bacterium]HPP94040.1 hypothetical protein [Spirochaetota bacterium]HRS62549.1 hypothetical protein [Spirochaetota bacterium]HRU64358.1 hypothetical protein [Spirochaetota bacterium]